MYSEYQWRCCWLGNYSKSIEYQWRCSRPDVCTMKAPKLGTSELPGWRGAAKNMFQERSLITAIATPKFAYSVYYCYGSYSTSIENQWGCSWPDVKTMNARNIGTSVLAEWRRTSKNLFQERSSNTELATHQLASQLYYCYGS